MDASSATSGTKGLQLLPGQKFDREMQAFRCVLELICRQVESWRGCQFKFSNGSKNIWNIIQMALYSFFQNTKVAQRQEASPNETTFELNKINFWFKFKLPLAKSSLCAWIVNTRMFHNFTFFEIKNAGGLIRSDLGHDEEIEKFFFDYSLF